ncbi:MAG: hypothetical protein EU530_05815 [Promethearchaeota archaeon]|nr:MAG: hypothetical protein EU530_05815 [Candidatus Lokiarchaeota archaeon]
MTLEVPGQNHQKVTYDGDHIKKVGFILIFFFKIIVIHFITAIVHESAHILSCIAFGGEFTRVNFVFLGISATWEHIDGIQGAIIALSGACSVAVISLFVYRPLFTTSKTLFAKRLCLIGIVQLSQEMFYWTFGSMLGGIPFPWKNSNSIIDPVYLAQSLSLGSFMYIFSLIFFPLFFLCRKLNRNVLTEYCSLNSVQSIGQSEWKSKFVLYTTKIYIVLFQILNIVAFVF